MSDKIKHVVVTVTFIVFMAVTVSMCVVAYFNPMERSESERRDLAQFPTDVTWEGIVDKTVIDEFEDYTVDQFPLRDFFRSLKANFVMNVLQMKENNGYAMEDGSIVIVKSQYTEAEWAALTQRLSRIQWVYQNLLSGKSDQVYISVIPDKNYYFGEEYGYPMPDYETLLSQVQGALPEMTYIDLFGSLELSDYYKTDWHWNQAYLGDVMATLGDAMGFSDRISGKYEVETLEGFRGGYYDQSALYPDLEQLIYLNNEILDGCTVYEYTFGTTTSLYFPDIFHHTEDYVGKVDYDFFMNGRCGVQRIDNPNATTDKELIVFRDSYGASLLPLMAEGYKTIYSIDLRDTLPMTLNSIIDFEGKDVLFLYSTTVLVGEESFK